MITPYFGDIRNIIIESLKEARFDIYVAVAWFTDRQLFDILIDKAQKGLNVEVVLIKDEINSNNSFDYNNFVEKGGKLFWDDHHHKFCVIDRKTVITGSYNWTYKANNRLKRENIIVIKDEIELIDKYSSEFRTLLQSAEKQKLPNKIEYIEREVEKIVEIEKIKIVENTLFINRRNNLLHKTHDIRLNWWRQLNKEWKRIFSIVLNKDIVMDNPSKNDLIKLFELTNIDLSRFEIDEISPLLVIGNLQSINFSKISEKNIQELEKGLEGIKIVIINR